MTALDDLIAAVEAGAYEGNPPKFNAFADDFEAALGLKPSYSDGWGAYRGSLDAALRLHEALLPGCGWDIWRTMDHLPNGMSRTMYGCNLPMTDTAYTDNPSRSWLLAILRALKAKEAGNE